MLPVLTDCFDSSQKTPQKCAVIQCCYHSLDNKSFIFYRNTHSQVEISWLESHSWRWTFEVMARDFCTWSTCLVRALGTFRRFPDTSRHPRKKMVAQTSPLSLGVCTCAFVCIFVCWKIGKWRRRNPPKKFKSEHAVVVAMLIIYFLNFFFIYHCFTSKSNISSAFHMYLFTFLW